MLKGIFKYFLVGTIVAFGGVLFSDMVGDFFNGMAYGDAANLGMGVYLCIVIITCAGIVISHMNKK